MIMTRRQRGSESLSRRCRHLAVAAAMALAALVLTAPVTLAAEPTGEYAVFSDCPLANPEVNQCIYAQTTSGEFKIGNETVPIKKTITLQGGLIANEETGAETFVAAEDGNTLSKTPQSVPGGLLGIVAPELLPVGVREIFNEIIEKGPTGVTATAELAGPIAINEGNLILGEGVALTLPLKIHLSNAFLGENCYIGSEAAPVTLQLTTGTTSPPAPNTPIKGNIGELKFKEEGRILVISNNKLVDNSYAAPAAKGCGGLLALVVNPVVNAKLGLPAAAGKNTAILEGMLEQGAAKAVRNSE